MIFLLIYCKVHIIYKNICPQNELMSLRKHVKKDFPTVLTFEHIDAQPGTL